MNKSTHFDGIDADFLHSSAGPPVSIEGVTPQDPSRFLNRELSWLAFNWRVLGEAGNTNLPILERVRMLAISNSNLDEFFTVRVAGLREIFRRGFEAISMDEMTAADQLAQIDTNASALMDEQQRLWHALQSELVDHDILVLNREDVTDKQLEFVKAFFETQVFPIISPMAVDPAHPFPFISSGGLALALNLKRKDTGKRLRALLPIPAQVDRFIEMPCDGSGCQSYLLLENVLLLCIKDIFPGFDLENFCTFRVLRDSDLEIEDEAEDLLREFETALIRRRRGEVVRLNLSTDAPADLAEMIRNALGVDAAEIYKINGLIGIGDLSALVDSGRDEHKWPTYTPRIPERVKDFNGDIFAAIRQKDMLLQHPYESFDIVVNFLHQAARDPHVVAIKQTLYRTSKNSPIVDALCRAAENGKSVTALVELKARFDEAANIEQSRRLEQAGAHVVYGFIDLKTHAKISTVVRREGDKLVTYTHFGTGNYHPITANIYTDLSYFTSSKSLGRDAAKVFNYVSGYAQPDGLKKLSVSPLFLKDDLIASINAEAETAASGGEGAIWAKMNAIVDPDVIDALYAASQAGVKIELVVRGICCLRPGVTGLSENIRVKSIVGRFLEHSRIVCFGNGKALPNKGAKVQISSADWMGRNLHGRVETLVSIHNKTVHAQIVNQVMAANLADQANSWVLQPDGRYLRHSKSSDADLFNCHRFFMENPSLSGRGKVGAKDVPKLTHSDDDNDVIRQ